MASACGFVLVSALFLASLSPSDAQSTPGTTPLTIEEVLKLSQGGFSEDLIITKIKKNGRAFNLSAEELLGLKGSGVSENVIKYLLDPSQPYSPPPPPAPPVRPEPASAAAPKPGPPLRKFPEDEFASRVPPEPGLYRLPGGVPARI